MRRWLAVLLVVFLPLQSSWAAVVDYCMHDAGAGSDPVGHHQPAAHGHAAPAVDDATAQADGASAAGAHVDCHHCHGHCTGMLDAAAGLQPQPPGSAPPVRGDARCAEPAPARPDRPQWAGLA